MSRWTVLLFIAFGGCSAVSSDQTGARSGSATLGPAPPSISVQPAASPPIVSPRSGCLNRQLEACLTELATGMKIDSDNLAIQFSIHNKRDVNGNLLPGHDLFTVFGYLLDGAGSIMLSFDLSSE